MKIKTKQNKNEVNLTKCISSWTISFSLTHIYTHPNTT